MTDQVKLRRGSTASHSTFIGVQGEITYDTDKKTIVAHDGATAGGNPLALASTQKGLSNTWHYTTAGTYTWTKPTGLSKVRVIVHGAGGGAGKSTFSVGGGGGGAAIRMIDSTLLSSTVTVTVGAAGSATTAASGSGSAGGSSSFGTYLSATGGSGGSSSATQITTAHSSPGVGSGGDVNLTGNAGISPGARTGDACSFGVGGPALTLGGYTNGSGGNGNAGNGFDGFVIVEEIYGPL